MQTKSIFEIIVENLTPDDQLPHSFSLPREETPPNELRFAPGARDGIGIFHTNLRSAEEITAEIVQMLNQICKGEKPSLMHKLFSKKSVKRDTQNEQNRIAAIINENSTISIIDPVLEALRQNHENIDIENLIQYAASLAFKSSDIELVKLGIALFGLLDLTNNKEIKNRLLILALYDEFTLFCIVALSNCRNANLLIYNIARKVNGWGKIHAVERLQPETDEIKDWLLRNGCENTVMDAYLGLECATKGDLIEVLREGDLDDELFDGIGVIINALLDEGPTDGISAYEYASEALLLYLQIAEVRAVTVKHLWNIFNLKSWLEDNDIADRGILQNICESIINRSGWQESIRDILALPDDDRFFFAYNTARRLNMEISPQIFDAVKANPVKHYSYLPLLYQNPAYAKELTELYENILPLDQMEKGMGDYLFAPTYCAEHGCLDFILQELVKYPHMGERLVCTAITSPVCRSRNGAIKVMEAWCEMTGNSLLEISKELHAMVSSISPTEINSDYKERMEKLVGDIG